MLASRALLAAQRQGGYAKLQQAVMHDTAAPTMASLRAAADPAIQARLDHNLQLAAALHVEGTPALIIGDRLIPGAIDLPGLRSAIAASR